MRAAAEPAADAREGADALRRRALLGQGAARPVARGAAGGGRLGRFYVAVARPVLKSRARAWTFIILVALATFASLALFYTKDVTVKLLPFEPVTYAIKSRNVSSR